MIVNDDFPSVEWKSSILLLLTSAQFPTCCCSMASLCDFSIWFIFTLMLDSWYWKSALSSVSCRTVLQSIPQTNHKKAVIQLWLIQAGSQAKLMTNLSVLLEDGLIPLLQESLQWHHLLFQLADENEVVCSSRVHWLGDGTTGVGERKQREPNAEIRRGNQHVEARSF